jgi:hypothetical protein
MLELATNPATDPDILRKLSRSSDRAIRQAVAENPNTPIDVLWKLMEDFPCIVMENPVLQLLSVENPCWLVDVPQQSLIELFRAHDFHKSFSFLEIIAENTKWNIDGRCAWENILHGFMSIHHISSTEYLERTIFMCHGHVGSSFERLFGNPKVTADCFTKFSEYGNSVLCHNVLHIMTGSKSILPANLQTQDFIELIIDRMMNNPRSDDFVKARIFNFDLPLEQANSLFGSLSIDCQFIVARDSYYAEELATREDFPKEVLMGLALNPYPKVRQNLLANIKIHADLLAELANHPSPQVREFAQKHPNAPK